MTAGGVGQGFFRGRNAWWGDVPRAPPSSPALWVLRGQSCQARYQAARKGCGANAHSWAIQLVNTAQSHPNAVKSSPGDQFCHTELPEEETRGEKTSDMLLTGS